MQTKLKCGIYTRVSTDNQAEKEFNSCEAQALKIQSFIKSQENMAVYKVYSDAGFTGANISRLALQQMIEDIKQNKIDLVIAYKIDRLTRSPKDFYQLIELFEQYKVNFISVTERFDTSTPAGRLLRNIMLTFAQFERELTSERTKDKMIERAKKGLWNGGMTPFGYKTENKKLAIKENEARIVREIFDLYVSLGSVIEVYAELRKKGIRDRIGQFFSKTKISYILRNQTYTGKIKYCGSVYSGSHEPIVSKEVFKVAQEIHGNKKRTFPVYKNFLLSRLVKCEECNSYMTPCYTNKRKGRKLKRYYYYRCTSTLKRDWNDCSTRQVNANRLEDYVFSNLERISLDDHYLDSLIFKLNHTVKGDPTGFELREEPLTYSKERFQKILKELVKGVKEGKGVEKKVRAQKYLKEIRYGKKLVKIRLSYLSSSENLLEDCSDKLFDQKQAVKENQPRQKNEFFPGTWETNGTASGCHREL